MKTQLIALGRGAVAPGPRELHFEKLEARLLLSMTPAEQQFVYLLNLARHDPAAYQKEAGLSVDLSGISPRPPLAVNDRLMQSAGRHSDEMAAHDYLGHQSPITRVWPNKAARTEGYALPRTWADDANYIESVAAGDGFDDPHAPLEALIVDQGLAEATHRRHLLGLDEFYAANREIGVGYATDSDSTYGHYWTVQIARQDTADVFITGVAFADDSGNGRYDPGEGLPGLTVQSGDLVTTTNAAGGFSLAVRPNGLTRHLVIWGPGLTTPVTASVLVADANVEVDVVSGKRGGYLNFAETPSSAWTNPRNRLDVTDNQVVDPLDALRVINYLNANEPKELELPEVLADWQPPLVDTDGDGYVLPHDALLVINKLSRPAGVEEGEAPVESAPPSAAPAEHLWACRLPARGNHPPPSLPPLAIRVEARAVLARSSISPLLSRASDAWVRPEQRLVQGEPTPAQRPEESDAQLMAAELLQSEPLASLGWDGIS